MTTEHDYFIGFIAAGYLSNCVVRCRAFRIDVVDDVEFQCDLCAISKDASDTSIVFIAHDHGGDRFGHIKGSIVESANLTKFATSIVDPNYRPVVTKKEIELFRDLSIR